MHPKFVHLNVHSEFSLIDSLIRIPRLLEKCKRGSTGAVGLTDSNNLFAAAKFVKSAETAGVKPILGSEIDIMSENNKIGCYKVVLLCQNKIGFENLCAVLSDLHQVDQNPEKGRFRERQFFDSRLDGLIALSGDVGGDIGKLIASGNYDEAKVRLNNWNDLFDSNYFCQVSRLGAPFEEDYIRVVSDLVGLQIGLVATNQVRFLDQHEFDAHDARVCIQESRLLSDPARNRQYYDSQYLKTEDQMIELFSDVPSALANTVNIAVKCNIAFDQESYLMPKFPVQEGSNEEVVVSAQAKAGLKERLNSVDGATIGCDEEIYVKRLEEELSVITEMGFSGYFLIVADFIKWAKDKGIPVGPGRGSGAGSLVAYCLGITELDPIKYDLLFERFLNPERVSMPDFDVDFCMDRRDEVIDYVAQRYGKEKVAQIITFGKMAAKAVIRDVGRILGYPYPQVDELAKLIPAEVGITLPTIMDDPKSDLSKRYEVDEDTRTIVDLALKLEGLSRNAGTHAGGLVIAPSRLTKYTPLYGDKDANGMVTQFDMGDVESIGLVKFDLLGLKTLTIIEWALKSVNSLRLKKSLSKVNIGTIPLDDPETFQEIQKGKTVAIFQLESRGMRELILRLKPDKFDDLIALVALFRPGPLESGMVDDFISVKHGGTAKYPHPLLEEALRPTYGVILYQEQVMEIARSMAGFTLGSADILRRAMGKKKPEEMATQREAFLKGAEKKGVQSAKADLIFNLIEKFAGYGFNKSHSAAYALVAYQTAWLKTKYPGPFMAAVLSADMDNTDKIVNMIQECRTLAIEILKPDVNKSEYRFLAFEEKKIRYGLGAIKGLGSNIVDGILRERSAGGDYSSMIDLCKRVQEPRLNKKSLELLIKAGSFDSLEKNRKDCFRRIELALQLAEQDRLDKEVGQTDLFGLEQADYSDSTSLDEIQNLPSSENDFSSDELLAWEKESLGLYLTGHPIDSYYYDIKELARGSIAGMRVGKARIAGLIVGLRTVSTRRGEIAIVTVDDKTGFADFVLDNKVFQTHVDLLIPDKIAVFSGRCSTDRYTGRISMQVDSVDSLDALRERYARQIILEIEEEKITEDLVRYLEQTLRSSDRGHTEICLACVSEQSTAMFRLDGKWKIKVSTYLIERLNRLFSQDKIVIQYGEIV